MSKAIQLEVELPEDMARLHLPPGVQFRLQTLLDKQDAGTPLSENERMEAQGLTDMADFISLLRLRAQRLARES